MVFVLFVLSLLNGVFFQTPINPSFLIVYVVDFDGQVPPYHGGHPIVGPAIDQAAKSMPRSGPPHLGFISVPPWKFNKWDYAWPLHNCKQSTISVCPPVFIGRKNLWPTRIIAVVEAPRQMHFGLHSRIVLNIVVLVVWFVVKTLLFRAGVLFDASEQKKAGKKAAEREKEWTTAISKQRSRLDIPRKDGYMSEVH